MGTLQFGISTSCYYPLLTEEAVRRLVEAEVDCAEIFINSDSELSGSCFAEMRRILAAGRTKVLSLHPFTSGLEPLLFFSEYERRFLDGVEYYKRFFHAAAELGARYLVIHGDKSEDPATEGRYLDRYYRLNQAAKSFGVMLAQENVSRCRGRSPEFLAHMKAALGDDAVFVLDFKQARRAGVDYRQLLRLLGTSIVHLHISDWAGAEDCLPVGKGSMDFSALLKDLESADYSGGVILELYRRNYGGYDELLASYDYMKRLAAQG